MLESFINNCIEDELSERTLKQYKRVINEFLSYENINTKDDITKLKIIDFKKHIQEKNEKVATINNKLTIVNKFINYTFRDETDATRKSLQVDLMKVQNQYVVNDILSKNDYERLLRLAERKKKKQLYYLMLTLARTGIRVSELRYITYEAVKQGKTIVTNKGKTRQVEINKALAKDLMNYCKDENITTGIIFKSKSGKPLDNAYIYKQIQWIAGQAKVKKSKAHPHSFRHLFAKTYLEQGLGTPLQLADILGHSSLAITRMYTTKSEKENKKDLNKLDL